MMSRMFLILFFTAAACGLGCGDPGDESSAAELADGALTISPSSHGFGDVPVATLGAPKTFTLTNTSSRRVTKLAFKASAIFRKENNRCGVSLDPNASCTIDIRFRPNTPGNKTGTLTVTGRNARVTASLTGRGVTTTEFNVLAFGADPTGASSANEEIQAAIDAAAAGGGGTVIIPAGTFMITPISTDPPAVPIGHDPSAKVITVKRGVNIRGVGPTSILRFNTQHSFPWGRFAGLVVDGSQTLENFSIDGGRSAMPDRDALENGARCVIFYGITGKPGMSGVTFRDLKIVNIPGNPVTDRNCESFAITFGTGARDILCERIEARGTAGTGISVTADEPLPDIEPNGGGNLTVKDCVLSDNAWQGLSVYGASNVLIDNVLAENNTAVGLNFEWAHQTTVLNSTAKGSGLYNWRVMGKSSVSFVNCVAEGAVRGHEISVAEGGYHRDSLSAVPDRVSITGGRVSKIVDNLHYDLVLRGLDQPSHGGGHAIVELDVPGAQNWSVAGRTAIDTNVHWARFPTGVAYRNLAITGLAPLRPFSEWSGGGFTLSQPFGETGWTLSSQVRGAIFVGHAVLQPGVKYRIKIRARQWQAAQLENDEAAQRADGWSFVVQNVTSDPAAVRNIFSILYGGRADEQKWISAEGIVTIPNDRGVHRIVVWYDRSSSVQGAGRLDIESVVAEALSP